MSSYRPPLFSKFGKNVKDLLTKKYDYRNELTVKSKLQDVALENTVTLGNELGSFSDKVKATHSNKSYGETEVEVDTKGSASIEVKASKLVENTTVNIKGTQKDSFGNKSGFEYTQDNVSAHAAYEYASSHFVEGSLVVGFDGLAVGGMGRFDASKSDLADFNFGAQYATSAYTATLKTEKKADTLQASFFHNVPSTTAFKTQLGGQFAWDLTDQKRTLSVGVEHDVDANTNFKGKVSTDGLFATVIEHKLSNPVLKLAFSSSWKASDKSVKPSSFGVGLTFGEY